ncbi:Tyrosine-protein kinase abl1 [Balamuthia mandrillaris]
MKRRTCSLLLWLLLLLVWQVEVKAQRFSFGNYLVSAELVLPNTQFVGFGSGLASLESAPGAAGCRFAVGEGRLHTTTIYEVSYHPNGTEREVKEYVHDQEGVSGFGAVIAPLTDLNGDGRLEIAVTGEVPQGYPNKVYISSQTEDFFFNTTHFITLAIDQPPLSRFPVFQQRYNASLALPSEYAFGIDITFVGDIDRNGVGDIAITGDHRVESGDHSSIGSAVHILFLDESLDVLNVSTITLFPDDTIPAFASAAELGFQAGAFASTITGLGDLDGDNTPDMAVTARTNMIGYLFILFLTPDGGIKDYRVHSSDAAYSPSTPTATQFGWFGASIKNMGNEAALTEEERFSSADFNNDHCPDLVLYYAEEGPLFNAVFIIFFLTLVLVVLHLFPSSCSCYVGDVWILFLNNMGNITGNMYYGLGSQYYATASAVADVNDDSIPDVVIVGRTIGRLSALVMDGIRITVTAATFVEQEEEHSKPGTQQTLELKVTFEVELSAKPKFGIEVEFEVETNLAEEDVVVLSSSPLKFEPDQTSSSVELSAFVPVELFEQGRGKRKQEEEPTVTLVLKSAMNALVNNSNPSFTLALIKPEESSSSKDQTEESNAEQDQTRVIVPIVVTVVVVLLALMTAIGVGLWWRRRRNQRMVAATKAEMEIASQYGALEGGDFNDDEDGEEEDFVIEARDQWDIMYKELKFIEKIGEGASGEVWRGMWRSSPVAIKKLHTMDEEQLQDFQMEAQTLKALRPHGNVIRLLGIVSEEDKPFCIVTEFMHQGDLNSYLLNNKAKINHNIMLKWAVDIASGMHHLHSEGITHRDLATRNLLLTKCLQVKVADFGMSRQMEKVGGIQKTTKEVGPLKWMAPEAIEEHVYSEKSDVWSFGVCLWEIASFGAIPYDGLSPVNAAIRVCQQKASLLVPPEDIPPILRTVMLSCWAFSPAERPTFEDILQSLKEE